MGFTVTLLTNAHTKIAQDTCEDLQADGYIARADKPDTRALLLQLPVVDLVDVLLVYVRHEAAQFIVRHALQLLREGPAVRLLLLHQSTALFDKEEDRFLR